MKKNEMCHKSCICVNTVFNKVYVSDFSSFVSIFARDLHDVVIIYLLLVTKYLNLIFAITSLVMFEEIVK